MQLLKQLYCIHSMSMQEKKMRRFIINFCTSKGASYYTDKNGNVYVTKGHSETYPCIVAHMDQVQNEHAKDFHVIETNGILLAFSANKMCQQGLGADDKNGIWVALKCLEKYDVMKCAFFVGEEIGCVGSSSADMSFFDDCRFVVQCDRRGNGDFISNASGTELCSIEFEEATDMGLFGYSVEHGVMTDVMTLKQNGLKVSCCNMSCGYYNPHTNEEVTNINHLNNCLSFVEHIVEKCTKVYHHEHIEKHDFNFVNRSYDYYSRFIEEDVFMILQEEPTMSFDSLWNEIRNYYRNARKKDVKAMYDDFRYYYQCETELEEN